MLRIEGISKLLGKVKWFNNTKGYGFIVHTSGKDVFVHYSQIQTDGYKSLQEGEEVEYELIEGPKGLHALRVRPNRPHIQTAVPAAMHPEAPGPRDADIFIMER
ncbi:MAG: cold shock domain-containing protein [Deltaproteobacteria bacterium]|nr:cold shock domain-containing protein [Deltaproteobacteria bacterium]